MTDLTYLTELAKRATPGPWFVSDQKRVGYTVAKIASAAAVKSDVPDNGDPFADADFIAAANPQAILWLIAEVERLRSALLDVRDAFSNADAECFAATIGAINAALEGGGR